MITHPKDINQNLSVEMRGEFFFLSSLSLREFIFWLLYIYVTVADYLQGIKFSPPEQINDSFFLHKIVFT